MIYKDCIVARKNKFEIAKDKNGNHIKNIYTLINASAKVEYYAKNMIGLKSLALKV